MLCIIDLHRPFHFLHIIVFCVVEMWFVYFTLSETLSEVKFNIFCKTEFFSLPLKLTKQLYVISEIFRGIFLWCQEQFVCTELNLEDVCDLFAVLIKQNVLFLSVAVKLFIQFNAQHEKNVPKTALSELFGGNAVKTYHGHDVLFIWGTFSRLKLD